MSGQGPYFGQVAFFKFIHEEVVPTISPSFTPIADPPTQKNLISVIERFQKEVKRVTGVIDGHLKKTGKPYLVGDKISYVDLAWIPWFRGVGNYLIPDWDYAAEYPHFTAWLKSLLDRPAVKHTVEREEFQHH